jgi:hypothetical protein
MNWKSTPVILLIGVAAGYMFSRVLDGVPLINKLPKIRL